MPTNRILFLCPSCPSIGGIDTVTSLLVDYLVQQRYYVKVLVSSSEPLPGSRLEKHRDKIAVMEGRLNSRENLDFIKQYIHNQNIDVVINQGVFSAYGLQEDRSERPLLINVLHGMPFWEVAQFRTTPLGTLLGQCPSLAARLKMLMRYGLNRLIPGLSHPHIKSYYRERIDASDWFVVLSPAYKQLLEKTLYHRKNQPHLMVIPNPVEPAFPSDTPESTDWFVQKQPIILSAGRLVRVPKQIDRLLRVWKLIQYELPSWKLYILGDGEDRPRLESLAHALQLERCYFWGFQSMELFYREASIFCLTSSYEGAPMAVAEAMSYGLVPVAFDSFQSLHDMITDQQEGILVPSGDEKAFARELVKLATHPMHWQAMSQSAISKSKRWLPTVIGPQWESLWQAGSRKLNE